jgi:hypothetical protein
LPPALVMSSTTLSATPGSRRSSRQPEPLRPPARGRSPLRSLWTPRHDRDFVRKLAHRTLHMDADRNSDRDLDYRPDTAYEVLDSKLILFEPDAWLQRVNLPIRTSKRGVDLPLHVRMRLEELYRVYVFGCWVFWVYAGRSWSTLLAENSAGQKVGKGLQSVDFACRLSDRSQVMHRVVHRDWG